MDPLNIPPRYTHGTTDKHVPSPQQTQAPADTNEKEGHHENFFVEIIKFAVLALIIVIPFRMFVAQPFIVSGASMSPTFETGQYLIVDQVSYRFAPPVRGDVVIFKYPNDPSKYFIKRIVALPGETLELDGSVVRVTNAATGESIVLEEPYLPDPSYVSNPEKLTLNGSEYFVMGDNRAASSDSRVWGPVPADNIVGRALVRLLPPTTLSFLPGEFHFTSLAPEAVE